MFPHLHHACQCSQAENFVDAAIIEEFCTRRAASAAQVRELRHHIVSLLAVTIGPRLRSIDYVAPAGLRRVPAARRCARRRRRRRRVGCEPRVKHPRRAGARQGSWLAQGPGRQVTSANAPATRRSGLQRVRPALHVACCFAFAASHGAGAAVAFCTMLSCGALQCATASHSRRLRGLFEPHRRHRQRSNALHRSESR